MLKPIVERCERRRRWPVVVVATYLLVCALAAAWPGLKAASSKLTALSAITTALSTDLAYIVSDPGGTPASKKMTLGNLASVLWQWLQPDGAIVYHSADQSVTASTWTEMVFDSEAKDNGGVHSTSTNTGRITVRYDGVYFVVGKCYFNSDAVGIRAMRVTVNTNTSSYPVYANNEVGVSILAQDGKYVSLSANDYLRLWCYAATTGISAVADGVYGTLMQTFYVSQ